MANGNTWNPKTRMYEAIEHCDNRVFKTMPKTMTLDQIHSLEPGNILIFTMQDLIKYLETKGHPKASLAVFAYLEAFIEKLSENYDITWHDDPSFYGRVFCLKSK